MKAVCRLFIAMCTLCAAPHWAAAQTNDEERDIVAGYATGKLSGMLVTIMLEEKDALIAVEPQHSFKAGDKIKVALESNFRGYVYIVNYGSSGTNRLLFPSRGERNLIAARQLEYLPKTFSINFDEHIGVEVLRVFMSLRPIAFLAAARRPEGMLNERETAEIDKLWHAAEKQIGIVTNEVKITHDKRAAETRAPIWNERQKSSLVTLRRRKGQSGKLQPGTVAQGGDFRSTALQRGDSPDTARKATGVTELVWIDADHPEGLWTVPLENGRWIRTIVPISERRGVAVATLADPDERDADMRIIGPDGIEKLRIRESDGSTSEIVATPHGNFLAVGLLYPERLGKPNQGIVILDLTYDTRWTYTWTYGDDAEPLSWKIDDTGVLQVTTPLAIRSFDRLGKPIGFVKRK